MQAAPAASRSGRDRGVRVVREPLRRRRARRGRPRRIPRRRPRRAPRCISPAQRWARSRPCSRPSCPQASQRIRREAGHHADHARRSALPPHRHARRVTVALGTFLKAPKATDQERPQSNQSNGWIDSHTHVTAAEFDADRDAAMVRARAAGVVQMIAIGAGWGVDANEAAVRFAAQEPDVFAAVGVHPHDAPLLDDAGRAKLRAWLDAPRVVAVGECGLDYHYMNSPRDVQRAVCAEQIALARERDLPVSIHVRGDDPTAWEELLEIWRSEGRGDVSGVLHCYTGSARLRRAVRSTRDSTSRSPESSRSAPRTTCAKSPPRCPSTACWSRPTAPSSRRSRTAAGATNPLTSCTSVRRSPRCAASRSRRSRARPAPTRDASSACPLRRPPMPDEVASRPCARAAARARGRCDPARALRDRARDRHEEPPDRSRDRGRSRLRSADRRRNPPRAARPTTSSPRKAARTPTLARPGAG